MIRTVTVCAGTEPYAEAAQRHAMDWARMCGARLRALSVWDGDGSAPVAESPRKLMDRELDDLVEAARKEGIHTEGRSHGEGVRAALLAEARGSDLLVMGVPQDKAADDAPTRALLEAQLPVFREAEASILVVARPPAETPPQKMLVNYQGGIEGKTALRMAGTLAEAGGGGVTVLSISGDPVATTILTEAAEDYLGAFEDLDVHALEHKGTPDSEGRILEAAHDTEADVVVLGAEPYGLLDRLLNRDVAEQVALSTSRPILLAR